MDSRILRPSVCLILKIVFSHCCDSLTCPKSTVVKAIQEGYQVVYNKDVNIGT